MLTDGASAFSGRDVSKAIDVLRADAEMDRLRNLMFLRHIENPENIHRQASLQVIFMTSHSNAPAITPRISPKKSVTSSATPCPPCLHRPRQTVDRCLSTTFDAAITIAELWRGRVARE